MLSDLIHIVIIIYSGGIDRSADLGSVSLLILVYIVYLCYNDHNIELKK